MRGDLAAELGQDSRGGRAFRMEHEGKGACRLCGKPHTEVAGRMARPCLEWKVSGGVVQNELAHFRQGLGGLIIDA